MLIQNPLQGPAPAQTNDWHTFFKFQCNGSNIVCKSNLELVAKKAINSQHKKRTLPKGICM